MTMLEQLNKAKNAIDLDIEEMHYLFLQKYLTLNQAFEDVKEYMRFYG